MKPSTPMSTRSRDEATVPQHCHAARANRHALTRTCPGLAVLMTWVMRTRHAVVMTADENLV